MDIFALYLRKSRTDELMENRGNGDVLTSHRKTLRELAAYNGHIIAEEYAEVVSGDSLAARPQAQRLLMDVIAGKYAGVYCMDLDRLSRGAAEDQAAIIRAFQVSGAKIITPGKIYDLCNPQDEDFSELKLMFSRLEYKTIKRRMMAGRERAARDGWYIGARTPYGYKKIPAQGKNGPMLEVAPAEAEVVQEIYQMYADGMSTHAIARALDQRGIKPRTAKWWNSCSIISMLKNPLYIGKITWAKRVTNASKEKVANPDPILVQGRHEAIVEANLWNRVNEKLAGISAPVVKNGRTLQNPLHKIVYCKQCGGAMSRYAGSAPSRKHPIPDMLRCNNYGHCKQISAPIAAVEGMILDYLDNYFSPAAEPTPLQIKQKNDRLKAAKAIQSQIRTAEAQQSRQADLLEQGVYTVEEFIRRREELSQRLVALHGQYNELAAPEPSEQAYEAWRRIVPRSVSIREAYERAPDANTKNELLASVVKRIEYNKTAKRTGKNAPAEQFIELDIELLF